jgi:hypothetical protein
MHPIASTSSTNEKKEKNESKTATFPRPLDVTCQIERDKSPKNVSLHMGKSPFSAVGALNTTPSLSVVAESST